MENRTKKKKVSRTIMTRKYKEVTTDEGEILKSWYSYSKTDKVSNDIRIVTLD